jgi:GNAT superfamily N-acetyltransferase
MIRPATIRELSLIRASWCRAWNVRGIDLRHGMLAWGEGRKLAPAMARRMHSCLVDGLTSPSTCLVYAVPPVDDDAGSQPLAWLCRELVERGGEPHFVALHFVYTIAKARSRGLASELLRFANGEALALEVPLRPTHENAAGAALLRKLNDDRQRTDRHQAAV